MLKRKIIILFLFGLKFSAFSQSFSGEITYNVKLGYKPLNDKDEKYKRGSSIIADIVESSQKDIEAIKTKLKFNSVVAVYSMEQQMERDVSSKFEAATAMLKLNNTFYQFQKDKLLLKQTEAFDKTFLIKSSWDMNWEISKETKSINGYRCFKATTTEVVKNRSGVFESPVVAWFTPEIPNEYGPIGYGGLPGLILKLEVKSNFPAQYEAESIEISKKALKIKKPSGEEISEKEMNKKYEQSVGNRL
ncbi:GLPGLI family protein [Zunongwangia endophytica]|uniref:GLPGLI family protein n=1 Tax=Zunongwangia endophytica TaxID=1808945 RepID=A0ABV8H6U0_9FLAO|nr:GLPGLI family protein [Zunongwangia endophytica]MDN3595791.1 GLPGLI family protein [Zunongwangia endophytica]